MPTGSRSTTAALPTLSAIQSPGRYSPKIFRTSSRTSPSRSRVAFTSDAACSEVLPRSATMTPLEVSACSPRISAARAQISRRVAAGKARNSSRAWRAAAMASSTSSLDALAARAITLPSIGERTSNTSPLAAGRHVPPTSSCKSGTPSPGRMAGPKNSGTSTRTSSLTWTFIASPWAHTRSTRGSFPPAMGSNRPKRRPGPGRGLVSR